MVYEHDEPVETACGWGRGLARGVGRQNSMAKLDGSSGIGKRSVAMCDLCDETFFHS